MIDLALHRIENLLSHLGNPHLVPQIVHIAGTNGKGSVCAYISSVLKCSGIRTGRFTSPHMIDRWDCIAINDKPVEKKEFLIAEKLVMDVNIENNITATKFEVLTATAFTLLRDTEISVIEVGIGGRLDATNVFPRPAVTVITKIGLDHQGTLGSTIKEIAYEKAGIMKPGIDCVIDGTNEESAKRIFRKKADELGDVEIYETYRKKDGTASTIDESVSLRPSLAGFHQPQNLSCALAVISLLQKRFPRLNAETICQGIAETTWPGRLQLINLSHIHPNASKVLLDGAHNPQAASELGKYINGLGGRTGWIVGMARGKAVEEILRILVNSRDILAAVEFGKVDGMPWIQCVKAEDISRHVPEAKAFGHKVREAISWTAEQKVDNRFFECREIKHRK
ncbi:putative dihydrofolate synthetase [Neolecta irregularis DAH-3]|uniref:Putative dihydrofolate synthetase n=1 Tax=Neolecta irregularis (strain DAH-3) TaxID=1198029 RepID=A0A1U7LU18_NEOID|nr:putative dihydrofolate synthetase [Neolecta irregularis DAH-3]|eukprot:OLL26011.1 putative dihydrofolate synthetase [Neolecta irregularis DAH-3]